MTMQELHDSIKAINAELTALFAVENPTAEQVAEAKEKNGKLATFKLELKQAEEFSAMRAAHNPEQHNGGQSAAALPVAAKSNETATTVITSPSRQRKDGVDEAMAYKAGLFGQALVGSKEAVAKAAEIGMQIKTMVEGDNGLGGYLVPTELSSYVIYLAEQYGVALASARTETMGSDTKTVMRVLTGQTAYWGSENATLTGSDSSFDRINLVAKKLYSYANYSLELEQDSAINIGAQLLTTMARGAAKKIDEAFFVGDGSATYGGITGATTALKNLSGTIANIAGLRVGTGNAYNELTLADFAKTKGALPTFARTRNTAWYVSKDFFGETMERLALAAGGMTASEVVNGVPLDKFLGYPVKLVEAMPKVEGNSQVCALLGDLTLASTIGVRSQAVVTRDTSLGFGDDTVFVKSTWRLDAVTHEVGNASGTASARQAGAVVGLITAAS